MLRPAHFWNTSFKILMPNPAVTAVNQGFCTEGQISWRLCSVYLHRNACPERCERQSEGPALSTSWEQGFCQQRSPSAPHAVLIWLFPKGLCTINSGSYKNIALVPAPIITMATTGERGNWSGRDCPLLNAQATAPWQDRSGWCIYARAHIVRVVRASRHALCTRRAPACVLQVVNFISV